MSTDLESILSGEREVAPAPGATVTEPQPETSTEQPQAAVEPSSEADPQADETGKVPLAALHAERSKVKRYTEQVAEFQTKLEQQNAQWEQRFNQIFQQLQQKPANAEPAQPPDFWEDPNSFVKSETRQVVEPLQAQLRAMARTVAEVRYQPETVSKAVDAFDQAVNSRQIDPEIHRRIMAAPNPYEAAVQWHQHNTTMAEIGSDPAAYKAKLAEEIRAQVMAEIQQGNPPAGSTSPAPVMPGNFAAGRNVGSRSGPAYAGPPTLEDILHRR